MIAKKTISPGGLFADNTPKLPIIHAKAVGHSEATLEELFRGFNSLKILTYSNGIHILKTIADWFDDIEIVFGREDIINDTAKLIQFQMLLLNEIRETLLVPKPFQHLRERVEMGSIRFQVVQEMISHEKLYLLSGDAGQNRVISGSANFSQRGFGGKQNEGIYCFDNDDLAWSLALEKYEWVKSQSTTNITREALNSDQVQIDDIPLFNPARATPHNGLPQIIVIRDSIPEPTVIQKIIDNPVPKVYQELSRSLTPDKGVTRIDRKIALSTINYIKSNSRTEEVNSEEVLSINVYEKIIYYAGKRYNTHVDDSAVASDVQTLISYFEGYNCFKGNTERLSKDYFTFLSWLYISPFLCDLRNKAHSEGAYIYDYPIFGILYGKSNCGKSELIKFILKSMFGLEGFLEKAWFTRTGVSSIRQQNKRYPMAFDDLDSKRFTDHAISLIKEDTLSLHEYPAVILSMNSDRDSFESEVRKRSIVFYTDASLPDHTGESRDLARRVKAIKTQMGTALYKRFLALAMERLSTTTPKDILAFSTEILVDIFQSTGLQIPYWCRETTINQYSEHKHDKVKNDLTELWNYNKKAWQVVGDRIMLKIDSASTNRLKRDIPDYLLTCNRAGDTLIFKRSELEYFLNIRFKKNWFF